MTSRADRVLAELSPLEAPMKELGFTLRASGKLRFERRDGRKSSLGMRLFWILIHRSSASAPPGFFLGWNVFARPDPAYQPLGVALDPTGTSLKRIVHTSSRQIPGWKSHRYSDCSAESEDFRLDHPDYIRDVRPLLRENLLVGARFILELSGDLRRAADFAASQPGPASAISAIELYLHLGDAHAARTVLAQARLHSEWTRWSTLDPTWKRLGERLTPKLVP